MGLYMGVYNRGGFDMLVMQCLRVGYASLVFSIYTRDFIPCLYLWKIYRNFRKIRKSPGNSENFGNASKPFFLKAYTIFEHLRT